MVRLVRKSSRGFSSIWLTSFSFCLLGERKLCCLRSRTLWFSLLGQREIRFRVARYRHWFGLALRPLVPGGHGVAPVRNIFNLVAPGLVRSGKVGSGNDHDVS